MKRKELQSPFLSAFQARARMKMYLITMPDFSRTAIARAIREVRLPLREVSKLNKQEAWNKFCNRLLSGVAGISATPESKRILKEYRELLNL